MDCPRTKGRLLIQTCEIDITSGIIKSLPSNVSFVRDKPMREYRFSLCKMAKTKLLYKFCKILGLCPFTLTKDGTIRFSYFGLIYSLNLSILYTFAYINVISDYENVKLTGKTPVLKAVDNVVITYQFLMVVTTWLVFAFGQNRLRKFQKSFKKIFHTCKILGIQENHDKILKKWKILLQVYNAIWVLLFVLGHCQRALPVNPFLSAPYNLGRILYPNFVVLYVCVLDVLRDQFQSLNEKLREISEFDPTGIEIGELIRCKRTKKCGIEPHMESKFFALSSQLHVELVDLTESIVDFLSPPLYLTFMTHFSESASASYLGYIILKYEDMSNIANIIFYIGPCLSFTIHTCGLLMEIAISESVTSQANQTANILHEILITKPTKSRVESGKIWSLRLLQKSLSINVWGMPVEFSVMYNICSVVVGYVTLMIQVDTDLRTGTNTTNTTDWF